MMTPLLLLAVLAALAWYVVSGLKAREIGVAAARDLCGREGLQFLDDSVVANGVRITRGDDGRLTFQRSFAFEFSNTGDNRLPGLVTLVGDTVTLLQLTPRDPGPLPFPHDDD